MFPCDWFCCPFPQKRISISGEVQNCMESLGKYAVLLPLYEMAYRTDKICPAVRMLGVAARFQVVQPSCFCFCRNLPKAIFVSITLVTVVYVAANVAYFTTVAPAEILTASAVAVVSICVALSLAALPPRERTVYWNDARNPLAPFSENRQYTLCAFHTLLQKTTIQLCESDLELWHLWMTRGQLLGWRICSLGHKFVWSGEEVFFLFHCREFAMLKLILDEAEIGTKGKLFLDSRCQNENQRTKSAGSDKM